LLWSDISLDRRTITVRAFNSKTARSRTVAMTTRVYAWLSAWREASPKDNDGQVFQVRTSIKTAFDKALKAARITGFHFHDTRATAISRMIQAGMPPAEVMRVSGHSTLRAFYVYVRADLDTAYRAASALDEFLARSTPVETFDA